MSVTVGVREFRQDLADYIDQAEPVTVTRHGQTVGLFIPVHRDRHAEIAAYSEAAKKAGALLAQLGMTEDEAVAEFDSARKERRETAVPVGERVDRLELVAQSARSSRRSGSPDGGV